MDKLSVQSASIRRFSKVTPF